MIVGKTSSSISKTEIFTKYSETEVLSKVFPEITSIPCIIKSPFREDAHPSFSIFMGDNKHLYYKDFGDSDEKGSLLDLLCKLWHCTFNQCLNKICEIMVNEEQSDVIVRPKQIKTLTRKEASDLSKLEIKERPWRDYDYRYWKSYGIEPDWLHYTEIRPITFKIITKEGKKYIFPADRLAYAFVEWKDDILSLKVYQPMNTDGFKWCSKMSDGVISLWTKVPECGDKIIIASSVKDALCISSVTHIPAVAPQGEGYNLSETACKELKRRYKEVFISFDGDKAGVKDAAKLSEKTGFINVQCPILNTPSEDNEDVKWLISQGLQKKNEAKDWSDIYLYFGKDRFVHEFNKAFSIKANNN